MHSEDELGELAASFNKMTEDLARAHAEITAWTRTLEDRVERKTQELEQAYTGLVASEKMASLGKLAATVAHEVNNPLFGILTYSRLVLKDLEEAELGLRRPRPQAVEQLRIIERESKRCGEIMKNLLAFARQSPPRRQPQDVNVLVRRALVLVRHQLELQGVELCRQPCPGSAPLYVRRGPDTASRSGVAGERGRGDAARRTSGGGARVSTPAALPSSSACGTTGRALRRTCFRTFSNPSSPPRRTSTARGWGWRWPATSPSGTAAR